MLSLLADIELTARREECREINEKILSAESEISLLENESYSFMSLEELEERAIALGMRHIQRGQTVYLTLDGG